MNFRLTSQMPQLRKRRFGLQSCMMCVFSMLVAFCVSVEAEEDLRSRYNLTPLPPIPYPVDNTFNPDRIELGRLLFFDPILGGEKDVACGTCHLPKFGMADGRRLAAGTSGHGFGPDRVLGFSAVSGDTIIEEPRHTMTVFNTAFNKDESGEASTKGFMLWDGKDRGLEAQALRAIIVRVELRGDAYPREMAVDSVLARLRSIPDYVELFKKAFPAEADSVARQIPRLACEWDTTPLQSVITRSTLGRSIAAFERELVTDNSPYDRYVAGDDGALNESQKRGLEVFFDKGNCASCHSGPEFSEGRFRVQGVEQIGPGQPLASTNTGTPRPSGRDRGRFVTSGNREDLFAFRTVSLRQVAKTPPYMHDGALSTLEEVIEFYDRGGGDEESIDPERIDSNLFSLGLTDGEKDDLLHFLEALTDETIHVKLPPRVPSGLKPAWIELVDPESGLVGDYSLMLASAKFSTSLLIHPNPFNSSTLIKFEVPQSGSLDLFIYNVLGQKVRHLMSTDLAAGKHSVQWNGYDEYGKSLASGVYFVTLQGIGFSAKQRLLLLR